MKNIIILVFFVLANGCLFAQQLPLFTIYRDQWNVLNPAYLSNNYLVNEKNMSVGASYRRQWAGIEDGPQTQVLNWEYVHEEHPITTGAFVVNDRAGVFGQTGLYGQFAYRMELGRRTKQSLSIGLHAGMVQYRAKLRDIEWRETGDEVSENDVEFQPDFGFGFFFHKADKFYIGASVPQLFGLMTEFKTPEGKFPILHSPHFYAVGGGYFPVSWFNSDNSFLEPSLWVRSAPHVPLSLDANIRYQMGERFWAGIGAGVYMGKPFSSALHVELGTILAGELLNLPDSQLKIGFGFDWPLGLYRPTFGGSGEVHIIYAWGRY